MAISNNLLLAYHFIVHLILGLSRDMFWERVVLEGSEHDTQKTEVVHAQYKIVRMAFSILMSVVLGWAFIFLTWCVRNKDIESPFGQLFLVERTTIPISFGLLLSSIIAAYTEMDYDIYIICSGCFCALVFYILTERMILIDGVILPIFAIGTFLFVSHTSNKDITFIEVAMMTTIIVSQLVIHVSLKGTVHFSKKIQWPKLMSLILSYNAILIGFAVLSPIHRDIPWTKAHLFIVDATIGYLSVYATYFLLRKVDSRVIAAIESLKRIGLYVFDANTMTLESWIGFTLVTGSLVFYLLYGIVVYRGKPQYKRD